MTEAKLNQITKTVNGYPVKNLRWLERDNIITGLVKCPLFGNNNLHEGFVSCQWSRHGKPLKINKGREDLKLLLS